LKSLNESEKKFGRFSPNQIDKEISSLGKSFFMELLLGFHLCFTSTCLFTNEKSKTEIIDNKSENELKQNIQMSLYVLRQNNGKPRDNNENSYLFRSQYYSKGTKILYNQILMETLKSKFEDFKIKLFLFF
jgi:hypothetical protein